MQNKLLFLVLITLAVFLLQGCGVKARIKKADKQFEIGEYFSAGEIYKSVYGKVSANDKALRSRIAFQQGECNRLLNYFQSEKAYANAVRYGYADSIVFLRYAQALHRNGKYADAAKYYTLYSKKDSTNILAKEGVGLVQYIEKIKAEDTGYKVKRADAFNVRRTNTFSPVFIGSDADMLFFSSNRNFNKKIVLKNSEITGLPNSKLFYVRKNSTGKWEKPEIISSEVNTLTTDDGICSFSPDGKIMYFTRARQQIDAEIGAEIYSSTRAGGAWSEPKKVTFFADSTITVAHPAIAPDGETIYFVSDAPKGLGGKDIWKGKLEGGECKYIENLGNQINTSGDEMFPVVRHNGILYFSSNGRLGFGGLDIFKAEKQKNESWKIVNLGSPINSQGDDYGITFEGNLEKGYFTSNRGEVRGYDALWSFELPTKEYILEGRVIDDQKMPIADAVIRLVSNTGMNARIVTKKDGSYRIKLEKNMECVMMASARGYLNSESKLSTVGINESKTFIVDFMLSAIYKPIQINNIFYEFGKWNLTPESEKGLQALVKVLKDNPNITIELSAHTDYISNNASNKLLSEKRAKSVVDYLISAGITPARLTAVGYGEEKPFVVDVITAKSYNFLKENDVLEEAFVLKLKPEQQEIANQINRRTEFKVLKTNYK